MEHTKTLNKSKTPNTQSAGGETVEVLYQKMGDRWFAFSLIDDEVFVGSITQDEIDHSPAAAKEARVHRRTGNS